MKRTLLAALLVLPLLAGCASHYVITLSNGTRVSTNSKPKLKDGSYLFKDREGHPASISAGRVREIAPAGSYEEGKTQYIR